MGEIIITKCFEKCGVEQDDVEDDISVDAEFDALVKELCDQTTSEEFVSFDSEYRRLLSPYQPAFDTSEENWREVLQPECIDSVVNNEIGPESDDEIEDVTEEIFNVPPTPSECRELLNTLIQVSISNEEISLLNSITKRFEMAIIERKTQKTIEGYFS